MTTYGAVGTLLADSARAVWNLVVAIAFTQRDRPLLQMVLPLGAVIVGAVAIAAATADWSASFHLDIESPFSMRYVLGFGGVA